MPSRTSATRPDRGEQLIESLRRFANASGDHAAREREALAAILADVEQAWDELKPAERAGAAILARDAFRRVAPATQKQLGQFLTPTFVAGAACAAAIRSPAARVIDPTCGDGAMVWSAWSRLQYLGSRRPRVAGIEIDPLLASIASLAPSRRFAATRQRPEIICRDVFSEVGGLADATGTPHVHEYDAVVGNPPYIRYQGLSGLLEHGWTSLASAFRQALPHRRPPQIVDAIIRSALIAHLVPADRTCASSFALEATRALKERGLPGVTDPADAQWIRLVASYSGLSDVAVPAWLLTWLLAKPDGMVAYVTTDSPRNREFGRILRYFMLKFLSPILTIQQEGSGWFADAQVTTSLMVFRARRRDEIALPLPELVASSSDEMLHVRVSRSTNLAADFGWDDVDGFVPEEAARFIGDLFREGTQPEDSRLVAEMQSARDLFDALLREDRAARRAGAPGTPIEELEDYARPIGAVRISAAEHRPHVPADVVDALAMNGMPLRVQQLEDIGVRVNQGLRTGCNPFFYGRVLNGEELTRVLPGHDAVEISEVLSEPKAHRRRLSRLLAQLRSRGAFIPNGTPSELSGSLDAVRLSELFENRIGIFPRATLGPVVRYQRSLAEWGPAGYAEVVDVALVTHSLARSSDLARLRAYPRHWLTHWRRKNGLAPLCSSIERYIDAAERVAVRVNGRVVPIPALTAVAPNVQLPKKPGVTDASTNGVPPAPRWWYSLPIRPRHYGDVFMPRVIHERGTAYINPRASYLVDANFTTFTVDGARCTPFALFALLNGNVLRAVLECHATPMGGGALKVEAAHLRTLAVPELGADEMTTLDRLGRALHAAKEPKDGVTSQIDHVLLSALGVPPRRLRSAAERLRHLALQRRELRRR